MEKTTDRIKRYLQDITEIQTLKSRQVGMLQERVTMLKTCDKSSDFEILRDAYLETMEDCITLINLYNDRITKRRIWIEEELQKLES